MKYRVNYLMAMIAFLIGSTILNAKDISHAGFLLANILHATAVVGVFLNFLHWYVYGRRDKNLTKWLVIRADVRRGLDTNPGDIAFIYVFTHADTQNDALDQGARLLLQKRKVPAGCTANDIAIRIK